MDPSIIYGLTSAVAYGAADYLSQSAGKNVGTWRTSFYYYGLGFILLSGWILFGPTGFQHGLQGPLIGWLISVGSGFSLLAAVVLFTQGLIKGSIAVVAPIAASYGAVTTILSCISGERFTFWTGLGIGLTIAGACGAAVPRIGTRLTEQALGIQWACSAAIAYGFGFWLQGLAVPAMGPVLPIWIVYGTGLAILTVLHLLRLIDLSPPRSVWLLVPGLAAAALSIIAFVALTLGLRTGRIAIVVVLSSLTSAVTVVLARSIGRVRIAWHQWIAIACIVLGLSLMKS